MKILVVDDEPDIREFIRYNLAKEGYEVIVAENGREAIRLAEEFRPRLILMDMMMPEMDGSQACQAIRQNPLITDTMIVFLSAVCEEESLVRSYSAGADDYITKPVSMRVLCGRVNAIMRRHGSRKRLIDNRLIDERRAFLTSEGEVKLSLKEYDILHLLYSEPSRIFTRQEIFNSVWGDNVVVGDRTLDVHIRHLRSKIGEQHISTCKGVGFKYEE